MLLSLVFDTLHRGGVPDGLQLVGTRNLLLSPICSKHTEAKCLPCRVEDIGGESERRLQSYFGGYGTGSILLTSPESRPSVKEVLPLRR